MTTLRRAVVAVLAAVLAIACLGTSSPSDAMVRTTRSTIERYRDSRAALAAGYTPQPTLSDIVHYVDPTLLDSDQVVPTHPAGLVYQRTSTGDRLLGAFFLKHQVPAGGGPRSGWHAHTECVGAATVTVPASGATCPPHTRTLTAPAMLHIWLPEVSPTPFAAALPRNSYVCILG